MAATTYPNYSPGLEGIVAGITRICEIDKEHSRLIYRGIDSHDLAEMGSFEETAYLLFYGELPNAQKLSEFKATLAANRDVPQQVYDVLRLLPTSTHPMDYARAGFATLASFDPDYATPPTDHEANQFCRCCAAGGTIAPWSVFEPKSGRGWPRQSALRGFSQPLPARYLAIRERTRES